MNRRDEENNRRDRDNRENRSGNRNMGQDQESMYRGAYRFDDHRTTRDQYGDRHDNHQDDRGQANQRNTYGQSNNYGNMGSYGGAQGFGSSRGGRGHREENRSGFDSTSGHGRHTVPGNNRQIYGAYWDKNSFSDRDHDRFSEEHREHRQDPNRDLRRDDNNQEDNSRYEIYDTSQSFYNSMPEQTSISYNPNHRIDEDFRRDQERDYGSNQRPRNRQGSGNDQDRHYGTDYNERNEGNMAGSSSRGYDGQRGDEDRSRHYDPMSGSVNRDPSRNRNNDRADRENRDRQRGGYDGNNRHRNERDQNR
ncbi:hypothetical protein [Adhaeribacter rhizoryzae]|uniref:Uncharacterized protein n=1 Tax=Adhaeribacter rhizoryzae TaxID=2607907 RepID=A0A5M6DMI3_9BACT|nr:hypothetical protein [Adhaeribacter rhizoryzae]KAA5548758.1 hypothetical protein F0145_04400 [Adhaeribacter rhizoryzae]